MSELYCHAIKDLGVMEYHVGTHPRIKQALALAPSWLDQDDDKTAWCGLIMGLWFHELGWPLPAKHYRAIQWKDVGRQVTKPQKGDLAIWRNHVGIFDSWKGAGILQTLGGNQSDAVTIEGLKAQGLLGFRRVE